MMARHRYPSRQRVSMWTFSWESLRGVGELIGGALFLVVMIFGLNVIAMF